MREKEMPPNTEATETAGLLPVVPFLKIPDEGDPYLAGSRCTDCGTTFLGERANCAKCGSRKEMEALTLSNSGELYVFSIVCRSFPGIDVPYVSAIVDLDGGGTIKGNLINIDPEPEKIQMGMPVEVVYRKAPRKDAEGNEYLAYYFQPKS
jgi:uncharacterized OB-fold protein